MHIGVQDLQGNIKLLQVHWTSAYVASSIYCPHPYSYIQPSFAIPTTMHQTVQTD